MTEAEKFVEPIVEAMELITKTALKSDEAVVDLVKEVIKRMNANEAHTDRTDKLVTELLQAVAIRIRSLEDKVDMLMELHRLGDNN